MYDIIDYMPFIKKTIRNKSEMFLVVGDDCVSTNIKKITYTNCANQFTSDESVQTFGNYVRRPEEVVSFSNYGFPLDGRSYIRNPNDPKAPVVFLDAVSDENGDFPSTAYPSVRIYYNLDYSDDLPGTNLLGCLIGVAVGNRVNTVPNSLEVKINWWSKTKNKGTLYVSEFQTDNLSLANYAYKMTQFADYAPFVIQSIEVTFKSTKKPNMNAMLSYVLPFYGYCYDDTQITSYEETTSADVLMSTLPQGTMSASLRLQFYNSYERLLLQDSSVKYVHPMYKYYTDECGPITIPGTYWYLTDVVADTSQKQKNIVLMSFSGNTIFDKMQNFAFNSLYSDPEQSTLTQTFPYWFNTDKDWQDPERVSKPDFFWAMYQCFNNHESIQYFTDEYLKHLEFRPLAPKTEYLGETLQAWANGVGCILRRLRQSQDIQIDCGTFTKLSVSNKSENFYDGSFSLDTIVDAINKGTAVAYAYFTQCNFRLDGTPYIWGSQQTTEKRNSPFGLRSKYMTYEDGRWSITPIIVLDKAASAVSTCYGGQDMGQSEFIWIKAGYLHPQYYTLTYVIQDNEISLDFQVPKEERFRTWFKIDVSTQAAMTIDPYNGVFKITVGPMWNDLGNQIYSADAVIWMGQGTPYTIEESEIFDTLEEIQQEKYDKLTFRKSNWSSRTVGNFAEYTYTDPGEYTIDWDKPTLLKQITPTSPATVELETLSQYSPYKTVFKLSNGSGKVTFNGVQTNESFTETSRAYTSGENELVIEPLVPTNSDFNYLNFLEGSLKNPKVYEFEMLGAPWLDVLDKVILQNYGYCWVESISISYNGALRSSIKVRLIQ